MNHSELLTENNLEVSSWFMEFKRKQVGGVLPEA